MFQVLAIGNIGGDALCKGDNGHEFVTFRIAHNERYKDSQGVEHSSTQWIDCVMDGRPKVLDFLKAGTLVFVQGAASLRIFDSAKDRCKKAGVQVKVSRVELIGSQSDAVPSRLFDVDGKPYNVAKYYHADIAGVVLKSQRGEEFAVDDNGWVYPYAEAQQQMNAKSKENAKRK